MDQRCQRSTGGLRTCRGEGLPAPQARGDDQPVDLRVSHPRAWKAMLRACARQMGLTWAHSVQIGCAQS
jgi:hypothetical protein